jgi:hypothetical protein
MHDSVTVSARFVEALQRHHERAYRLWRRAGVDPTTGSKLIHGAALVRPNDPRIIAVGRELGLAPDQCFETAVDEGRVDTVSTTAGAHA